jgi:hypothetical protein
VHCTAAASVAHALHAVQLAKCMCWCLGLPASVTPGVSRDKGAMVQVGLPNLRLALDRLTWQWTGVTLRC